MDVVIDFSHVQGETSSPRWQHPVSFQVERGTLHLIRTRSVFSAPLFRLLLGFSDPVSGDVRVNGTQPAKLERSAVREYRRRIGSVLDPDGLVANLSVRMNLVVPLVFATGLDFDVAMTKVEETLDVMHLRMWAELRPAALPAEVRQAVALARALSPGTDLMMLENPLSSVDNRETRRLLSLCRAQAETLLIATHRHDSILHEFADAVWEWDEDGFRVAA